jgi:SAM-dependent methyltransferase
MGKESGISYKEYYEDAGKSTDIWDWHGQKFEYYREILRYRNIAHAIGKQSLQILDLGCGDGFLSCMLAEMGHTVDAMDISDERLKKFKDKAVKLGIVQISGSVFEYPFPKNYNIVIMSEVLEHLEDYVSILKKANSILRPGGRLIIAVPYKEKIKTCKCPYCLKEFNFYGHIHSFDESRFNIIADELDSRIINIKTLNNKLSAYFSKYSPVKSYLLYKMSDRIFSTIKKRMDTHMIVEMGKK